MSRRSTGEAGSACAGQPACVPFRQRQNKQRIKPMTNVQRSRRQVRLSRALGIALTPKAQRIFEKRPYAPGEHGRTRRRTESDYAVRLREKQRLRAQYGISEKQLRAAYEKGTHTAGQTGNAMLTDLETRHRRSSVLPRQAGPDHPGQGQEPDHGSVPGRCRRRAP